MAPRTASLPSARPSRDRHSLSRPTARSRPGLPRLRAALESAPLALLTVVLLSSSALAHARFDHSTPSPGQVLNAPPAAVDIYTAQDMRKTAGADEITVTGPDQSDVDNGPTVVDDSNRRHMSVALKPDLPPGRYLVSFKTLSDEDGEADHGQFAFYVGVQPSNDQKLQDEKLSLTSESEGAPAPSHTGFYVAIAVAAAAVVLLAASLVTGLRRLRRAAK